MLLSRSMADRIFSRITHSYLQRAPATLNCKEKENPNMAWNLACAPKFAYNPHPDFTFRTFYSIRVGYTQESTALPNPSNPHPPTLTPYIHLEVQCIVCLSLRELLQCFTIRWSLIYCHVPGSLFSWILQWLWLHPQEIAAKPCQGYVHVIEKEELVGGVRRFIEVFGTEKIESCILFF